MTEAADVTSERSPRFATPSGGTLVALVAALCFLAGTIGWTIGRGRPPARDSPDVGFLYDMVAHHTQAIDMAQAELVHGTVPGVKVFAEEIHRFQAYEIGLMDRMLDEWGYDLEDTPPTAMTWMGHATDPDAMPGLATEAELRQLSAGDGSPDAVFLALMIDHHAGGLAMAEEAARRADDAEVRALASRMATTQRFEISELRSAGRRAGLDAEPEGVTYDVYDPMTGAIRPSHH